MYEWGEKIFNMLKKYYQFVKEENKVLRGWEEIRWLQLVGLFFFLQLGKNVNDSNMVFIYKYLFSGYWY